MANEQLNDLITRGLAAMKAGGEIAQEATSEIQGDATNDRLKSALKKGNETSREWWNRIDQAIQEAGESDNQENDILEAHYRVSQEIREEAEDDYSRDLGIIAAGQMALHYWIASFGTMEAYMKQAGLTEGAENMKRCKEEAKQADEEHTDIAFEIMGATEPSYS